MYAKVLEIDDQEVYLQVENQIRFKSEYQLGLEGQRIAAADTVDFSFDYQNTCGPVVIKDIVEQACELVSA